MRSMVSASQQENEADSRKVSTSKHKQHIYHTYIIISLLYLYLDLLSLFNGWCIYMCIYICILVCFSSSTCLQPLRIVQSRSLPESKVRLLQAGPAWYAYISFISSSLLWRSSYPLDLSCLICLSHSRISLSVHEYIHTRSWSSSCSVRCLLVIWCFQSVELNLDSRSLIMHII